MNNFFCAGVFALGLLSACGKGASAPAGDISSFRAGDNIPVTRAACTPFGDVPRSIVPVANDLIQQTCLPDGAAMPAWSDADGTARTACLYEPSSAASDHKLPLIIYIHPSAVTSDFALFGSQLLSSQATADLSGDPARPGFILVAPEGRTTDHFYPTPDDNAPGWDNWYRQFDPLRNVNGTDFSTNVDAATIDHFAQEAIDRGSVDTSRIYVMGWSNGSAMGILYSLNRPFVAAAAVYSAPNPFGAFNDPCTQDAVKNFPVSDLQNQVSNPGVPIYHLHNACDVGGICPNGLAMRDQLHAAGVAEVDDVIIDNTLAQVGACDDSCGTNPLADYGGVQDPSGYFVNAPGYTLGLVNHLRWPTSWTSEMFAYLRAHPQAAR